MRFRMEQKSRSRRRWELAAPHTKEHAIFKPTQGRMKEHTLVSTRQHRLQFRLHRPHLIDRARYCASRDNFPQFRRSDAVMKLVLRRMSKSSLTRMTPMRLPIRVLSELVKAVTDSVRWGRRVVGKSGRSSSLLEIGPWTFNLRVDSTA